MIRFLPPMPARAPHEPHRTATPLELLFDLVFVVAIAQAAAGLHHAVVEAHALQGLVGYLMVFFAIWWAWMNFTWFASAYDCDDAPYRILVFVQMAGALILAAGVSAMFAAHAPNGATIVGYVVMRAAMVTQWLRVANSGPDRRRTALRYAGGVTLVQVAWAASFLAGMLTLPAFVVLAAAELSVPAWAERAARTPWHPHHIAERYGLLTLIVLGESVLAATVAIQAAVSAGTGVGPYVPVIAGGLLTMFSMWWMYFDRPAHDLLTNIRRAFTWGYGHFVIFAATAAVGAGLAVTVDQIAGKTTITAAASGAAVAIPVAIYLLCLSWLHDRPEFRQTRAFGPVAALLVLLSPLTGHAAPVTGVVLASMIGAKSWWLRAGAQADVRRR